MTTTNETTTAMAMDATVAEESVMVGIKEVLKICGNISRTTWYDLMSAGKTPEPIRLGGRVLWLRDDLIAWCRAGCPSRDRWATMRKNKKSGKS